jgi:hypothetical protein
MYALQHLNSQSSTAYSCTKFQPEFEVTDAAGTVAKKNAYKVLNNQYMVYNGFNYPHNMNNCVYNGTTEVSGYKLSTYMNLVFNGLLWNGSGYEGYDLFNEIYGRYYTYDVEKDASVQATSANINMSFKETVNATLIALSSNTFTLTVAYDEFGNVSGTPLKTVI